MDTISEYRVLKSAAGYYVGREYFELEGRYWGPYERITGYYPTADAAGPALRDYILSSCETEVEFDEVVALL